MSPVHRNQLMWIINIIPATTLWTLGGLATTLWTLG